MQGVGHHDKRVAQQLQTAPPRARPLKATVVESDISRGLASAERRKNAPKRKETGSFLQATEEMMAVSQNHTSLNRPREESPSE